MLETEVSGKGRLPWKVGSETWEGDGAAGVVIEDADGLIVAFVTSWSDRGQPTRAQKRDWDNARFIVESVNSNE